MDFETSKNIAFLQCNVDFSLKLTLTWFWTVVVSKCFCSTNGSCSFKIADIFCLSGTLTLDILSPSTPSSSLTAHFLLQFDVLIWLDVASFLSLKNFSLSPSPIPPLFVTNCEWRSWILELTSPAIKKDCL